MLSRMRARFLTQHQRYPLRWHLGVLLLIKATLLYLIWLAWFSQPISLDSRQVAADLLISAPASSCSREDTCHATQP